jgi:hypothetical protein
VYGYHNNGICNGYQWSRRFNVLDYRNNIWNKSFWTNNYYRISSTGSPNLLPGNYTFRVTDANGCFYSESTVAPVTPIAIAGNKTSDVLCKEDLQVQEFIPFQEMLP